MLAEILHAIGGNGIISIGELSRKLDTSSAVVLGAMADLTRQGYVECHPPPYSWRGCGSACMGCRAMPECRSTTWSLTDKARKFLHAV